MKIKYYLTTLLVISFILFSFSSCQELDRHYEGGTQDDEQIQAAVEALSHRINAEVSGMYALLGKPFGYFTTANPGRADDFGYPAISLGQDMNSGDMLNLVSGYDWFSVALEWSDRTPTYANSQLRLGLFYNVLYAAATALKSIPEDTENEVLIYKRGQIKAMQAFCYLSLAPYFQYKYKGNEDLPSVPIMSDEKDPKNNPRAPLEELYTLIINTLTESIDDLDGFVRTNKGDIDQQVAYGFRARAYLYMEEWASAVRDADAAMAGYPPYAMSDLTAPGFYNASDKNWIWALLLPSDLIANRLASWPSQIGSFSGNGYVAYAGIYRSINSLLYAKIPTTDVRRAWWLDENKQSPYLNGLTWTDETNKITYSGQDIVDASIPDVKQPMDKYTNVKFGQRAGVGSPYNEGDWCMMRAEEMIFIKAEATAKAGNLGEGKSILENFVKSNRDPSYASRANSVSEFENEVWFQRRVELWGEGFAMADVMRLGKNVVRYIPGRETNVPEDYRFNISADDPWMLLRFVQRETTNNAGMVNNTGGTQPKQGDGAGLTDGVTN